MGYFHDEFVQRKKWINEHAYADLVALCQFLPGPASSQVGMAIKLCPDKQRASIAVLAAILVMLMPSAFLQLIVIIIGAVIGIIFYDKNKNFHIRR